MYGREIDGDALTLSASGWLYDDTFVLYDYETESLWYHMPGENGLTCIGGTYAGRKLEELQSFKGRWSVWKAQNPSSMYLDVFSLPGPR